MRRKLLLGLLALVVMGSPAPANAARFSQREVPLDQRGQPVNPLYGGYTQVRNSATAEMIVCSGRCLLAAIIMGTGPSTSSIAVRNTSVANATGALLFSNYRFSPVAATFPGNNPIVLPILVDKGISVTLSAASTDEQATILYLDMN